LSQNLSNVHCTINNEYHESAGHTNEFYSENDYKHVATVLVKNNHCRMALYYYSNQIKGIIELVWPN